MCRPHEKLGYSVLVTALTGAFALLLQGSAASAQTYLFNKSGLATAPNPAAVATRHSKNRRPVTAAPEIDANLPSGGTGGPSNRLKKAIKHYQSAGQALKSRDIDGAVAEYRKALEEDPDEPYWHLALAMALKQKGDRQGILDDYEVARKLAPDDEALRSAYDSLSASAPGEHAEAAGTRGRHG